MVNAESTEHTPVVHLEIAAFSILLKGIEVQRLLEICPNYAPFTASQQYPQLFKASLHAVDDLESPNNVNKYEDLIEYLGYSIHICKNLQYFDISLTGTQTECLAHIQATQAFSHYHITFRHNHQTTSQVLNLAMMMCFTFSGLSHKLLLLHAAGIYLDNRCCLLLGKSGTGKSTHAQLWLKHVPGSKLLTDDCTALRIMADQTIQVYSTPWNAAVPCTSNTSCKLQAFVRLKQAPTNAISRLTPIQAFASLLSVCARLSDYPATSSVCEQTLEVLATRTSHFKLHCLPNKTAVKCCRQAVFTSQQSNIP